MNLVAAIFNMIHKEKDELNGITQWRKRAKVCFLRDI